MEFLCVHVTWALYCISQQLATLLFSCQRPTKKTQAVVTTRLHSKASLLLHPSTSCPTLPPIPFCRLPMFSHLRRIYGIKVELRDLRLANVAHVLSSVRALPGASHVITESLQALGGLQGSGGMNRQAASDHMHPAHQWLRACRFFHGITSTWPEQSFTAGGGSKFQMIYGALQVAEEPMWLILAP